MAKKKRAKTTTSTRPAASKQVWAGQDPTDAATTLPEIPAAMVDALQAGPSAAERRARLMAAEPIEAEDETAPEPEAAATDNVIPPRRTGWRVEERMPIRPETKAQETQRYVARLADHERRLALWEERQASDYRAQDIAHRTTCEVRQGCAHPAHVRKPRPWREATKHDLRHLMTCVYPGGHVRHGQPIEDERDCPTRDDAHLLPPRPLDARVEFCCALRCYPKDTKQALTECLSIPVPIRLQRQAELRRDPKAFGNLVDVGGGTATVLLRNTLSEATMWQYRAAGEIFDSANAPLRGPAE